MKPSNILSAGLLFYLLFMPLFAFLGDLKIECELSGGGDCIEYGYMQGIATAGMVFGILLSVGGAYKIVKEKHLSHLKRSVPSNFERDFKKLLKEQKPSKEQILSVLKNTHPYSLENFDGDYGEKSPSEFSSDVVKKKVSNY